MKQKKSVRLIAFVLILLLGTACQTTSSSGQNSQTNHLSNTSWELTGIHNKQVMTASMGDGIYLTFEPYENRLSGFAGCNRFFGNYRQDDAGGLTFDGLGSTKMMCRNMATETEFLNAIRLVNHYEISGASLRLYQGETQLASFSKIPYRK